MEDKNISFKVYDSFERIKLFANELNDISDTKLQEFAIRLLLNAPDYFFTIPASSTGKYHPPFSQGTGGLVRHTKCVIFFAKCNAESFDFIQKDIDLIIISALIHDILKQGKDKQSKYTVWEHPELASSYVLEHQKLYPHLINIEDAEQISKAVLCHMGKWQNHEIYLKGRKKFPLPTTLFELALQSADYMASRKELLEFNFIETENVVLPEFFEKIILNENKGKHVIENNSGDTVLTFGKHKGKTIKEVFEEDNGYIEWMLNTEGFSKYDIINDIKMFVQQNQ